LQGDYGKGLEAGKTMSSSYRFHYVLLVDLNTDVRDGYSNGSTDGRRRRFLSRTKRRDVPSCASWSALAGTRRSTTSVCTSPRCNPWPTTSV